jgi:hypothetical protein
LTKFTFGPQYYRGATTTLTGATSAGVAENQMLTFGATVHGTKLDHLSTATIE